MALTRTTVWSLGTAGLCLTLSAASWFLLVAPERAEAADLRVQTVVAESTNTGLEARIAQLEIDFAERPARDAELAAIRQALPDQPALAQLSRQVSAAGTDAGVTLDSVVTGAATAVVDPAAPVTAPVPAADAAGAEGTTAPAEPTDGSVAAPAEGSVDAGTPAPVDPAGVTAVPGTPVGSVLAAVPLTISVTGDFGASVLFLKQVQADIERALLVDSVGMTVVPAAPAAEGVEEVPEGTVTTVITARVFVFVDAASATTPAVTP